MGTAGPFATGAAVLAVAIFAPTGPVRAAPLEFATINDGIAFETSDIRGVRAGPDEEGTIGLTVCLDREAARAFAAFTERKIGQRLEVRIAGITVSAPIVRQAIEGGCAFVSGMTAEEAAAYRETLLGAAPGQEAFQDEAANTDR